MALDSGRERLLSFILASTTHVDGFIRDGCRGTLGDLAMINLMQVPHPYQTIIAL